MPKQILLEHTTAPGDITVMTALPRDIAHAYPGEYELFVATTCSTLWDNNPYITEVFQHDGRKRHQWSGQRCKLDYGRFLRHLYKDRRHFVTAFHRSFEELTNVPVPVRLPHGDLHLTEQERAERPIPERYWAIFPGGKTDMTTKIYSSARWQQLIDYLCAFGLRFVQLGSTATRPQHINPLLHNVHSLVGKVDLRGVLQTIFHADGVICPITFGMHVAGALQKPCVAIAGGREHWWWEAYVNITPSLFGPHAKPVEVEHKYLHTQGQLTCCDKGGCWKNKVRKIEYDKRQSHCVKPVEDGYSQVIPRCLDMITVSHIAQAVMSYYQSGELPPIGEVPQLKLPPPQLITLTKTQPSIAVAAEPPSVPIIETPVAPASIFDHEIIGGKFTIFVLMYGNYHDLHKRCLNAILSSVPPDRHELRVATNEVCTETAKYLSKLVDSGRISKLYFSNSNRKKYPVMREMFWDKEAPITTKWLLWFDDDSIADRDPRWLEKLAAVITQNAPGGAALFGDRRVVKLQSGQREWYAKRPWFKPNHFVLRNGTPGPNGDHIPLVAGGFWAMSVEAMRKCNIPDPLLHHNGGDCNIGMNIVCCGYKLCSFNGKKQFVHTSSVKRRGLDEPHPGTQLWHAMFK